MPLAQFPPTNWFPAMQPDELTRLANELLAGRLKLEDFVARAGEAATPSARLAQATLDLDRARRCGYPEVIYAEGKTDEALREIAARLLAADQPLLATRVTPPQAEVLAAVAPSGFYHPLARTFRAEPEGTPPRETVGWAPVITAGSSDLPVAEEARETLTWMGVRTALIADVGVAGPHRLAERLNEFHDADVVVVAAGMEGALPSVVGGYLPCPVIAVPTSVGYGAALGGMAALLGMLTSCAANVAVVNIDAGFKAGFLAGLIARRRK